MTVKQNSWLLRRLCSGSANWCNPFGKQSDRRWIWIHENVPPFDPAGPLLGINLNEVIQQKRVPCVKVTIAALSITATMRSHLRGRLSKLQLINLMELQGTREWTALQRCRGGLAVPRPQQLGGNVQWEEQTVKSCVYSVKNTSPCATESDRRVLKG